MNTTTENDPARFDVRSIPCRVKHAQIIQRWLALPLEAHFVLVNDHDPVPLYYQFAATFPGEFSWDYLATGPDEFAVKITRVATAKDPATRPAPISGGCGHHAPKTSTDLDARGLEPPEPMMRILSAIEALPPGVTLCARTDRQPLHLLPELAARGIRHTCETQPDGSWLTRLSRA